MEKEKAFNFDKRPTLEDVELFVGNWESNDLDDSNVKLRKKNSEGKWAKFKNWRGEIDNLMPSSPSEFKYEGEGLKIIIDDEYVVEQVDSFGGMDQGSEYYYIMSIHKKGQKKHKTYWQHYGYYASHDGGHLENVTEVKPREKTITVWDNV